MARRAKLPRILEEHLSEKRATIAVVVERDPAARGQREEEHAMETAKIFHSILVGDDASEGANRAVEVAFAFAKCTSATVTLVGVLTPPSAEVQAEGYGLEEHEESQKNIRKALERTGQSGRAMGLTVEERVMTGDAEQALADVANEGNFDLIIVGHRNVSRIRRWLEKSTSQDLLRDSAASVLVVHQDSQART